jgi:rhamnulokinase
MPKEKNTFLAIDLGASNGRIIMGSIQGKSLKLETAHRFEHGTIEKNGLKVWNWKFILSEISMGLKKACEILGNEKITSISCDSWAQDFALLDENNNMIIEPVSYRDSRTRDMPESFANIISPRELHIRNGSALSPITTLCQLKAMANKKPDILEKSKKLLHVADLVHYSLCGKVNTDWTMATASQMWSIRNDKWDEELLKKLGINISLPRKITKVPTVIGRVLKGKAPHPKLAGIPVVSCAGHDTSAATATLLPLKPGKLILSLGTWAMLGCVIGEELKTELYPNGNIAFLGLPYGKWGMFKGESGMWPLQQCRKEWEAEGINLSWDDLDKMASASTVNSIIDLNDSSLFTPKKMPDAIVELCAETYQAMPQRPGDFAKVILSSLAESIAKEVQYLEKISGFSFNNISIVGGGVRNALLCDLIAEKSKLNVIKGPPEASATGNIILQAFAAGVIENENEVRYYLK